MRQSEIRGKGVATKGSRHGTTAEMEPSTEAAVGAEHPPRRGLSGRDWPPSPGVRRHVGEVAGRVSGGWCGGTGQREPARAVRAGGLPGDRGGGDQRRGGGGGRRT